MVEPLQVADWVNGLVILAAAALLLLVGDRGRIQLWLAALLAYRAIENILSTFLLAGPEWLYALSATWTHGLAGLWVVFALVFATTYSTQRWMPWIVVILVAGAALTWFRAVPGFAYDVTDGARVYRQPITSLLGWMHNVSRVAASAWVAWIAARHPQVAIQRAGILIAFGMIAFSWWDIAIFWAFPPYCAVIGNPDCAFLGPPLTWWAMGLTYSLTLLVVPIILWRAGGAARTMAKWLIGAAVFALVLWVFAYIEVSADGSALGPTRANLITMWTAKAMILLQPILLVYGILRYQILGLDLKMRWTVQASSLLAMFVAAFIVASQLAGAFIEDTYGSSLVGATATALLLVAIVPLKRLAARIGDAATPGAQRLDHLDYTGRSILYEEQLAFAWAGGGINKRERLRLESLRLRLAIPAEAALAMEARVAASG